MAMCGALVTAVGARGSLLIGGLGMLGVGGVGLSLYRRLVRRGEVVRPGGPYSAASS